MTLITEWEKLSRQFDKQDAAVIKRLVDAYGNGYRRILPEIDALTELITSQIEAGTLTKTSVANSATYKKLIDTITKELDDYEGFLKTEIEIASNAAARSGLASESYLTLAAFADVLGVEMREVPRDLVQRAAPETLDFLQDYLDKLAPRIDTLSNYHSQQIAQEILNGVSLGFNPQKIAKLITDGYGMGLTDAMRICRTAQLYSYREGNRAVQMANEDVLEDVVWYAHLGDGRTCASCVALHGKTFPVGTLCNDHHNGRCTMLPHVKGYPNPVTETGEDWFNQQSEATQRAILGTGKYGAYKDGKIAFDQLSTTRNDDVFGEMRVVASLKDLLPED